MLIKKREREKIMSAKKYDNDYKVQSVKLALEVGQSKAAKELGISKNTLCGWVRAARIGSLDIGETVIAGGKELSASEKNTQMAARIKALENEIRDLRERNEFLEEAAAFFAASRQKFAKRNGLNS